MSYFERIKFVAMYVAFACLCIQFIASPNNDDIAWYGISAVAVALSASFMDFIDELLIDREGDN